MPDSRLILIGMLHTFDAQDSIRNYAKTVNADIAKLADGKTIRFLDFGPALLEANGELKQSYYQADRLNLLPTAYRAWTDAMAPLLKEMLPGKTKP